MWPSFLFFFVGERRRKRMDEKKRNMLKGLVASKSEARILYCFKPVTGSWTLGNFLLPRREVRESQQEYRKQRPYTYYPSSKTYFDTLLGFCPFHLYYGCSQTTGWRWGGVLSALLTNARRLLGYTMFMDTVTTYLIAQCCWCFGIQHKKLLFQAFPGK